MWGMGNPVKENEDDNEDDLVNLLTMFQEDNDDEEEATRNSDANIATQNLVDRNKKQPKLSNWLKKVEIKKVIKKKVNSEVKSDTTSEQVKVTGKTKKIQQTIEWCWVRPVENNTISFNLDRTESSTDVTKAEAEGRTANVQEVGNLGEGAAEVGASHPSEGSEASGPEVDTGVESSSPPAQMRVQEKVLAEKREFLDERR